MISVIIPLYNKESSIRRSIGSVLAQSFQNFEIIVVDDGSTDRSVEYLESIKDSRIRLIRQKNQGVSVARNRGIKEAKGEFIALLDADDEWSPHCLATFNELREGYPSCDVFVVNYQFRCSDGTFRSSIINNVSFEGESGVLTNYFQVASTSHPPITAISIMVRSKAFETIGGFPVNIKSGEDLLTWARLACRYNIAFSKKVCATYNLGEGYDFANTPPRRQDPGDPVGKELLNLQREFHTPGIRKYISHWHKMRASVAIRYFERYETFVEACRSIGYNPLNIKVLPFLVLPFIPKCILSRIFLLH